MAAVTGQQVADLIGYGDDDAVVAVADQAVPIITAMARAYTRGRGFDGAEPNDQIAAVVVAASARLVANPAQLAQTIGSVNLRDGFSGWTLAERYVLNRYRVRYQ